MFCCQVGLISTIKWWKTREKSSPKKLRSQLLRHIILSVLSCYNQNSILEKIAITHADQIRSDHSFTHEGSGVFINYAIDYYYYFSSVSTPGHGIAFKCIISLFYFYIKWNWEKLKIFFTIITLLKQITDKVLTNNDRC